MSFQYKIEDRTISFSGKLLESTSINFDDQLIESLCKQPEVKVDLKHLEYLNSSGLALLIRLFTRIRNHGNEMIITNVSEKISKLFIMTKLNTIFNINQ